jgi:hypothetical protein
MIPDHVYVSGIKIDVVFDADLDSHDEDGRYLPGKLKIEIDPGISEDKAMMTFIHEIIEAINTIYDVGLKHHQINLLEAGLASTGLLGVKK